MVERSCIAVEVVLLIRRQQIGHVRMISPMKNTQVGVAVLDKMVMEGQAASREVAASMLDWQDAIINKPEYKYGF